MPMKPSNTPRSRRQCNPHEAWRPIIAEVADRHRLHPRDMMSGWKSNQAVAARQELWWLLNRERGISYAEIGRRTGGYDHTSVRHGVLVWEKRVGVANG